MGARWLERMRTFLVVVVFFLVAGNLSIMALTTWARGTTQTPAVPVMEGIDNLAAVDARVWRGAAPSSRGYEELAANGVDTVVDLRAEENIVIDEERLSDLGLRLVRIPMRDGQTPGQADIREFLDAVSSSTGKVFVHCGAGVGRTGTMAASYLVASGQAGALDALRRNLAVGPPSLEQISFVASMGPGDIAPPRLAVTAVSRVLDAPRRFWVRVRSVFA